MKVLYIDCLGGFTSSMLLGALIDMGASVAYAEQMSESAGIKTEIYSDRVRRGGTDAVFAYAKCMGRQTEPEFFSEYELKLRNMCESLGEDFAQSDNICTWLAVLHCIQSFGAECVICSPLADGSGIDEKTGLPVPGVKTLELIKMYRIPLRTLDVCRELISAEGAAFLGEAADKFGMLPLGSIKCVGYGAGEEEIDGCENIVRCVLTETQEDIFMAEELEKLITEII